LIQLSNGVATGNLEVQSNFGQNLATTQAYDNIQFGNTKENGLGFLFPSGPISIQEKNENGFGIHSLSKSHTLQRTKIGTAIVLKVSNKYEIINATRKQTRFEHLDEKKGNKIIESFEILVSNNSTNSAQIRVEDSLYRWNKFEIQNSSPKHRSHEYDSNTIFWTFKLNSLQKAKITYIVVYYL